MTLAKNLNLKIKNTQLAAILKIKKKKKEEAAALAIATAEAEKKLKEAPKKKKVEKPKAKKIQVQSSQVQDSQVQDSQVQGSQVQTPPQKEAKKPTPEEAKNQKTPPTQKKSPEPQKTPAAEELKKKEKTSPEQLARTTKDFKAKRLETRLGSGFDARDRHGLRIGEERTWRRRRHRSKVQSKEAIQASRPKAISVSIPISIKDLAQAMKLKVSELLAKLLMQGSPLTINDHLEDETTIELLGHELDCKITIDTSAEERLRITDKTIEQEIQAAPKDSLVSRSPVITFMGHVDHGKTSLIDKIRKSNLTSSEVGAITQHIGAFRCHRDAGQITILDTPGHEAFSMMRQRGAAITDIIVLVIAGDEGIMPQTDEAIKQARNAGVPMVIAINKNDKQNFNADNVYRQLADRDLLPEVWGGTTITVNCSATSSEGIPELLEMLFLQADILELKGNPRARARGAVIESQMHKGFGAVATILVQNGTLKLGDALLFEAVYAHVKTMHDEHGKPVAEAGPSIPVKITGLSGIPQAGCEFIVVESEKEARQLSQERISSVKRASLQRKKDSLEHLMERHQTRSEKKVLNLILRADVKGSVEAIKSSLLNIPTKKVELHFIVEEVGEISESDIELAATSNAVIIGFHTRLETHAESLMKQSKVVIKQRDIIYQIIDEVKELMTQTLDKIRQENEVGTFLVKQLFKVSQLGVIAGGQVTEGIIKRNHYVKVFRQKEMIWEGAIASLKRVKEDVREVSKGLECGILLEKFNNMQTDDEIKTFEVTYLQQEL